ncbi:MAG: DUF4250 domain-containing protein [Saccharofermentans sp.]|nr:DUF4250 domain-containing protein [Saccharofermentans sp.]
MALPKDPNMLLSYINTGLRDNYASLSDLCASMGEDEAHITEVLSKAGYVYNSGLNRFMQQD